MLLQVQEKLQESSQKLDLLKLALELCVAELPRGSSDRLELEKELSSLSPVRYRRSGEREVPSNKSQSPFDNICVLSKAADLTGNKWL